MDEETRFAIWRAERRARAWAAAAALAAGVAVVLGIVAVFVSLHGDSMRELVLRDAGGRTYCRIAPSASGGGRIDLFDPKGRPALTAMTGASGTGVLIADGGGLRDLPEGGALLDMAENGYGWWIWAMDGEPSMTAIAPGLGYTDCMIGAPECAGLRAFCRPSARPYNAGRPDGR
jgi:hypothetical protein